MEAQTVFSSLLASADADVLFSMAPDDFPTSGGEVTVDALLATLDGQNLLARLSEAVLGAADGCAAQLGMYGGLLLLAALSRKYRGCVHGEGTCISGQLMTYAVALCAFSRFSALLVSSASFFGTIHTQMMAALTTMTTLCAMRGCVSGAAVSGVGMAFFFAVAETITVGVLPSFLRLCAGLSLASSVGGEEDIGGFGALSGLLRRQFLWITGALMTVLCAVLSFQTVLARTADSLSMRAVKFTLSGMIPVVGGAVSEALSTVTAGFSLAEKTVGGFGIALILWQVLPPIGSQLLTRLVFSLSAVFASAVGLLQEERILRECASLTGFLCAVSAAVSVFYCLALCVCMRGGG